MKKLFSGLLKLVGKILKMIAVICLVLVALLLLNIFLLNRRTADEVQYSVGETIVANDVEFTLTRVEYSATGLSNTMDSTYLLPVEKVDHKNPYVPADGNVMISISYTVKNTGKADCDLGLWNIDFLYGDGYRFTTKNLDSFYSYADREWNRAETVAPLTSKECRAYIEVPAEVMENKDTPLQAQLSIGSRSLLEFYFVTDTGFIYTIR